MALLRSHPEGHRRLHGVRARCRSSTPRRRCTPRGSCPTCGRAPPGVEVVAMHALARLMLGPTFRNIQASWVKEGPKLAQLLLDRGRQRPRRHADQRVHLDVGRRPVRPARAARPSCGASSATPAASPRSATPLYTLVRTLRRRRGRGLAPRQDRGRGGALRLLSAARSRRASSASRRGSPRRRPVVLMPSHARLTTPIDGGRLWRK